MTADAPPTFVPIRSSPGAWTIDEIRRAPGQGWQRAVGLELGEIHPRAMMAVVRIEPRHLNSVGLVHGGVLLSLADSLGAIGALQNLAPDQRTATLESKANFLRPADGTLITARCVPVHIGRRTSVWTTSVENEAKQLVASIIQTQLHFSE